MASSEDRFLDNLRPRLWSVWLALALISTGYGIYGYYKDFFWSDALGVVQKVDPACIYSRKRSYSKYSNWQTIDCDAHEEAAKLTADGYKFDRTGEAVTIAYEAEAGRKIYARVNPWPPEGGPVKPGSTIRIRYPPDTPDQVEPAADPELNYILVLGLGSLLAMGGYKIFQRRRYKKADGSAQASSIS